MSRFSGEIGIGDVIVTREGPAILSWAIRLGARLMGLPSLVNHVVIVHHKDPVTGRWIGIEGRPSGTGWCDVTARLAGPLTNANTAQPKTEDQRYLVATAAEALVGTAYDWGAIAEAAEEALRLRVLTLAEWSDDAVPGAVICSAFADWAYERSGLDNPGGYLMTRFTTPAHWDRFIMDGRFLAFPRYDRFNTSGPEWTDDERQ